MFYVYAKFCRNRMKIKEIEACMLALWHAFLSGVNRHKLQSAWSDVCGQYCIFYLSHRARDQSMSNNVHLFNNDAILNDTKVSQFVKSHFRVLLKHSNVNLNQFSKKMFSIKLL